MDALTKLISTIEIAIRYLLTGAVISAATVLSTAEYRYFISWATENELIAAVAITTVGFIAFTFYRLVLWVHRRCNCLETRLVCAITSAH